eukprot:12905802-Prorocentrum_lima.AAC.1
MHETHDPHAHRQGRHECHSDEAMYKEGTNTTSGTHRLSPNPMTGVITDISERRGRVVPGPNSNITFVNGIAQKKVTDQGSWSS